MRKRMTLICGALCAMMPSHAAAAQETTHRDEERGFSFRLPEEWNALPDETVRLYDLELARRMPNKPFTYISAYMPAKGDEILYPYLLVQDQPSDMSGLSYGQLEAQLGSVDLNELVAEFIDLEGLADSSHYGLPVLDRENGRIVMNYNMNVVGVGEVRGMSIGFLGKNGIMQLNFFDEADRFETYLPQFLWMADTFAWDPGFEFVPASGGSGSSGGGIDWMRLLRSGAIWGAVGGVIGGIYVVMKKRQTDADA